ncbi:hypothetical protein T36_1816 [Helicobacter cinaedi]|uniref:hypothetical protein n=1 Tax=Helicobacter cinaedi TaxID=213 RepID=UPI001F470551|nr:hypothetical protein [Helicobacter cinaedi]BDB65340.1 hypothetical protein T36_1816 [Helicobacter cinaedi]
MKKVFVVILLSLSLSSNILAQEKSGLFLGATGGLGFITGVFFDTAGNDTSWDGVLMKETTYSTALDIKGGYQYWFSPRVGLGHICNMISILVALGTSKIINYLSIFNT